MEISTEITKSHYTEVKIRLACFLFKILCQWCTSQTIVVTLHYLFPLKIAKGSSSFHQNYMHCIWFELFKSISILFGQWKEWGQVYYKIGCLSENWTVLFLCIFLYVLKHFGWFWQYKIMWHKWHLVHTSYFLKIFDGVWCHVDGNMHGKFYADEVMHCTTRCCKLYGDFWEETGGDTRTHNLSLTGSHKGIFCACSGVF